MRFDGVTGRICSYLARHVIGCQLARIRNALYDVASNVCRALRRGTCSYANDAPPFRVAKYCAAVGAYTLQAGPYNHSLFTLRSLFMATWFVREVVPLAVIHRGD